MPKAVHENEIRDALSTRLHLIEPGLRCLATEYPLSSGIGGAGGRVDILARDVTGSLVVIELKRTEDAAEKALHELHKYVELFRRERGIGPADLRVAVVAVEWRTLRLAFSQAAREWSADFRGYQLTLDEDGVTPIAAERVEPLSEATIRSLTPIQLLIQPRDGDLDAAWKWAVDGLAAVGAHDVVGFDFRHQTYDAGVYIVVGRMPQYSSPIVVIVDEHGERELDEDSDAPAGYKTEYRALTALLRRPNRSTIEWTHPDALNQLLSDSTGWTLGAVRRAGVYSDAVLFSDRDLILDSASGGLSDVKYTGAARADHARRWTRFLDRAEFALGGNPNWGKLVPAWCKERAAENAHADLTIHIYNPCDFAAAIGFGWPEHIQNYVPTLFCVATAPGQPRRTLRGTLFATGRGFSPIDAFLIAHGDAQSWQLSRMFGSFWIHDQEFLRTLGLEYVLIEQVGGADQPVILQWEEDRIARLPQASGAAQPLDIWITRNFDTLTELAIMLKIELGLTQ
ncbi:endonuclease NucS domain-containing protein [Cryptosporangium minutisporangium]|uniref:Endonuclease NucS C-terminal domain-containing protein n=1 Tax=Cryptosporangium minutisporangium TaxID=113569 RepID=A0ABP6SPT3_9ACTN